MTNRNVVPFPLTGVPEDLRIARLTGLHPQRQEGLWMQRVRIPGGVLTARQWSALGRIAREHTPKTPLHLTTRQDVQIHDVTPEYVGAIQQALFEAGMTGVGAGGDTLRNIVVCPCAGLGKGKPDLVAFARRLQRTLEGFDGLRELPRKFKIALACSESCGQPWINDLGLVARKKGERWGFRVMVAGSLGAKPGTGMQLFDWLDAGEIPALALALLGVFAEHGDRQQRTRARLRHVRERVGDEAFTKLAREAFERTRHEGGSGPVELKIVEEDFNERLVLTFDRGDVTRQAAEALGEIAGDPGIAVRIDNRHRVILFGRNAQELARRVGQFAALADPSRVRPAIVTCPGARWCTRALTNTNALADRLRGELSGGRPTDLAICISGCPNGCAHSTVADVGLVGKLVTRDEAKTEVYDLWTGGGMGHTDKLGKLKKQTLNFDEAVAEAAKAATQRGRNLPDILIDGLSTLI